MRWAAAAIMIFALLPCGPPSIVAFGDSITVGYGARTRAAMWVDRLGQPVENLAVAGSTAAEQAAGPIAAYAGGASIALWMSCTNDLLRQTPVVSYTATLRSGVLLLQSRGLTVYLGTCLGLKPHPSLPPGTDARHTAYSSAAWAVALETGAILVDVDAVYDPLAMEATAPPHHPNDEGHAVIASAFRSAFLRRAYLPSVAGGYPAP